MRRTITLMMTLLLILTGIQTALAEEEERVLRVWNFFADARFDYAVQKTQEKFPGLQIKEMQEADNERLLNRLFSQDREIDIIGFQEWNNGISGQYLIRSGLLQPMNGYAHVMEKMEGLSGVVRAFQVGDAMLGVPNALEASLWYGNAALFAEVGFSYPEDDWTWQDVYKMGEKLYAYNQTHGTAYKLIFNYGNSCFPFAQYLYNTTDYAAGTHQLGQDSFRELVEMWMQLREWGVCQDFYDRPDANERFVYPDVLIAIRRLNFGVSGLAMADPAIEAGSEEQIYRMIMPPSGQGILPGLVNLYGLGITSFSQMKEEAAWFLYYYLEYIEQDQLQLNRYYISDGMGSLGPFNPEQVVWEAEGIKEGTWLWENLMHWLAYVDDCQGEYFDEHMARTVVNTAYWELRDGEISVDEYISRCVNIADRYLGE